MYRISSESRGAVVKVPEEGVVGRSSAFQYEKHCRVQRSCAKYCGQLLCHDRTRHSHALPVLQGRSWRCSTRPLLPVQAIHRMLGGLSPSGNDSWFTVMLHYVVTGKIPAKQVVAGNKFTQGVSYHFFAPSGETMHLMRIFFKVLHY